MTKKKTTKPSIPEENSHNDYGKVFTISLLLIFACSFPINIYFFYPNAIILSAIPLKVVPFMFVSACGLYYGMKLFDQTHKDESIFKKNIINTIKKNTQVKFLSFFKEGNNGKGTNWEITNLSHYTWDKARLIIERITEGKKEIEYHDLSQVTPLQRIDIPSQLDILPGMTTWRAMVITPRGHLTINPERIRDFDLEKAKRFIIETI